MNDEEISRLGRMEGKQDMILEELNKQDKVSRSSREQVHKILNNMEPRLQAVEKTVKEIEPTVKKFDKALTITGVIGVVVGVVVSNIKQIYFAIVGVH